MKAAYLVRSQKKKRKTKPKQVRQAKDAATTHAHNKKPALSITIRSSSACWRGYRIMMQSLDNLLRLVRLARVPGR